MEGRRVGGCVGEFSKLIWLIRRASLGADC
jgi:hypothetical protein